MYLAIALGVFGLGVGGIFLLGFSAKKKYTAARRAKSGKNSDQRELFENPTIAA
jgi:hypothetical protein